MFLAQSSLRGKRYAASRPRYQLLPQHKSHNLGFTAFVIPGFWLVFALRSVVGAVCWYALWTSDVGITSGGDTRPFRPFRLIHPPNYGFSFPGKLHPVSLFRYARHTG